ncbi:ATP-binding protein [Actinoplanes awajinensis]|uniref:Anti-sigma regulatory factor n=1 Tax=Actinoplanes awajinensis subsp. mycoplanecinus TaxID=135947 RepID=A0A117MKL6_9ACTN|nr:ATP-binding protein [Actinoplanes awajinensis]KUL22389.1 anti-sigma regulatory factor [Actinoplanes awajinensis subsp. mycoplanecinus]
MEPIRTSPPPPHAAQLRVWTLTSTAELQQLRAALQQELSGHPMLPDDDHGDVLDGIVLVATELATNAIRHGLPPTEIRLLRSDDHLILDVADHDLTTIPELADTRPLHAGGHGLHLAQAFSLDVGWYATEDSKHIWAIFPTQGESRVGSAAGPW